MKNSRTTTKSGVDLPEEGPRILREAGTEPRFSSDLIDVEDEGVFTCAGCGTELFDSDRKFESETGWPSFWDVSQDGNVETRADYSHGMERTEVVCAECGGHLGHVFDDGPEPCGSGTASTARRLTSSQSTTTGTVWFRQ